MILFLQRAVFAIAQRGWRISLYILAVFFIVGWLGMRLFEPNSALSDPSHYWWWFLVTITTVGYGDLYPATAGGRLIAGFVVLGGIAAMGIVFTQLASVFQHIRRSMMSGLAQLEARNHWVILGYHPGRTEEIVREIEADGDSSGRHIVLCFEPDQAQENPLPGVVMAVRGRLGSPDVAKRACLRAASRILLDGRDDHETLALAVWVHHVGGGAHLVAAVHDLREARERIAMVSPEIECVPHGLVPLLVQAGRSPGISRLYSNLMSNLQGHECYTLEVPEGAGPYRWLDLLVHFKSVHDATLIARAEAASGGFDVRENPGVEERVEGGMTLYYIASERIADPGWPPSASGVREYESA